MYVHIRKGPLIGRRALNQIITVLKNGMPPLETPLMRHGAPNCQKSVHQHAMDMDVYIVLTILSHFQNRPDKESTVGAVWFHFRSNFSHNNKGLEN